MTRLLFGVEASAQPSQANIFYLIYIASITIHTKDGKEKLCIKCFLYKHLFAQTHQGSINFLKKNLTRLSLPSIVCFVFPQFLSHTVIQDFKPRHFYRAVHYCCYRLLVKCGILGEAAPTRQKTVEWGLLPKDRGIRFCGRRGSLCRSQLRSCHSGSECLPSRFGTHSKEDTLRSKSF